MQLGKVTGFIVSTRKPDNITGKRLLVVEHVDEKLKNAGKTYACVDSVGAGIGDIVLCCSSSSARKTALTRDTCTDNTAVAIVDIISCGGEDVYKK